MKFTANTLNILKNYSTINQSVMLRKGNLIKTVSPGKDVMAVATLDEEIPSDAGIYNIAQFLSSLSLFADADVQFGTDHFDITDGNRTIKYTYAAENLILSPNKDAMDVKGVHTEFDMPWSEMKNLLNAAAVLQLPDIRVTSSTTGQVTIATVNKKNPTANIYEVNLPADTEGSGKRVEISTTKLKLLQGDYRVSIGSHIAEFKSDVITYWVALESEKK